MAPREMILCFAFWFFSVAGQAPDPGQKTVSGCDCKTQCTASVGTLYACDFCRTEGSCGNWAWRGRWDNCKWDEDKQFEAKSAQEKTDHFWKKIEDDTTHASGYPSITKILKESIRTSFDNMLDEMPAGREKAIHTIGSICKFKLDISDKSPYTGLFSPGVQEGFIRMGSAASYDKGGLTPGLGFKFLRTGVHSANFVALHSLDLGQSWNFFKHPQSNHISPPSGATAILAKKFNQASQCAPQVGLSDLAKYSRDGTEHNPPKFPFKLYMVPSQAVQTPEVEKTPDKMHAEMAAFPVGTTVYTVYACGKPMDTEAEMTPTDGGLEKVCGEPLLLGDIVTASKCTTSAYGDAKFFIRHQRIEEDWEYEPSFASGYDAAKVCGTRSITPSMQGAPPKCDAHLNDMLDTDIDRSPVEVV